MTKILLDGSNWASVVNSTLVEGSKLVFEDGFKCTVLEYYKAHFFRKGSKTALKIKYGNKTETIETDALRKAHCPQYKPKKHESKQKTFSYQNLELATELELVQLRDAILKELARREDAKQSKIAELEKELASLKAL